VPALLLCVVVGAGDGDGSALPIVGISPAKADTDRAQVRINAIPSRFMESLPIENYQFSGIRRCQKTGIGK
jgi:hypothetical protein